MIHLTNELVQEIRAHAERSYPHECCGALLGHVTQTEDNGVARATKTVAVLLATENRRGADVAARRYLIGPDDYRAIEREARARSLEIVGFYHSHPDHPGSPSEYDREHAFPWYSYVIVSVRAGRASDVTSWVLGDDRTAFAYEPIAVDGSELPARKQQVR